VQVLQHLDRGSRRRVDPVGGERVLGGIAEHVDVAVAGAGRHLEADRRLDRVGGAERGVAERRV